MTPSRLVRVFGSFALFLLASFAHAATTEFRVLFDTDRNPDTGCVVGGMSGVEQVFMTQVTDVPGSTRVTRTERRLCAGTVLGGPIDVDTSGWNAVFQSGPRELIFESRILLTAFGPAGMASDMRVGFDATRGSAVHTALVDDDGSEIILPASPVRRRATGSPGIARTINMDGALADWNEVPSAIYGIASEGSAPLRLLRVFTWDENPEPIAGKHLFFGVIARLDSTDPYADDDVFTREQGQNLTVGGPGVLENDEDPQGQDLDAEIVTEPSRGSVSIDGEEGGFTYQPNNPDSKATDSFEYKVKAGTRESNVARVKIKVSEPNETPEDGPVINDAVFSVQEFSPVGTVVGTVPVTDDPGATHTFMFTGGNVGDAFSISNAGVITVNKPAFLDHDTRPVFTLTVRVTDNGVPPLSDTATITVNVTAEPATNGAPTFTSPAAASVPENTTFVQTVTATDPEGQTLTYSISGGADGSDFTINATTGALSFLAPPDFESPTDTGANNTYVVTVEVTDGTNVRDQTITVTVTNVNEAPVFSSNATPTVQENTTAVVTVVAQDPESGAVTYSITGGADQAHFTINATTGALSFLSAPNFEAPADAGANNVYDVTVTANDGSNTPSQNIAVTVTNVNEAPAFTSGNSANVPENSTSVLTVTTTDPEGNTVTYSITGGADAALFSINASTGALSFNAPPNFEAPADSNANNVYELTVTASDGTNAPSQNITVTVTNVDEGPAFTSPNSANFAENGAGTVLTAVATDPEANAVSYSITGGADSGDLSINAGTGAITFNVSPNFEAPADADTNNTYVIQVTATSSGGSAVQTVTITVTDVNEQPTITSASSANVNEGTTAALTVTATDPDGTSPTFSIVGGADAADFTINATTGALSFAVAPNFEAPADADVNNVYLVTVRASDGTLFDDDALTITVLNVNEAPSFTSAATANVAENTTAVTTVTTTDPEGNTVTYSITGGADAALFSINSTTGAITFNSAPNFEAPGDAGANNVYDIVVTASDGTNSPTQNIAITVTNVNEAPVFTSSATPSVPENSTAVVTVTTTDAEGNTVTYSITGGADSALFSINGTTGALTFNSAPNFEAPADAGANNVYDVVVTASDGTNTPTQNIAVTVTNVNEAPVFTSSATPSVQENQTAAVTVTTTDPEGNTVTYSITGGADSALFSINGTTGALTFNSAPDFDTPTDAGANNVYDVVVTASDGTNTPTQAIAVTVTDTNEAPTFTSTATPSVAENGTAVVTVTVSDPESDTITFSITGGADAALFSINGTSGALTFNAPPNFESPSDADNNNVYEVVVTADDGPNAPTQSISVTVTDVNEGPAITSANNANFNEDATGTVLTVTATDPENDTVTFAITGGADMGDLSINTNTGAITFNATPDYEAPADADTNNTYVIQVTATSTGGTDVQTITITVDNVNDQPTITSGAPANVPENTAGTFHTVTATDPDGTSPTFSIVGGADAADFSINTTTGALSFAVAPNFEAPADANADNVYEVTVRATDGTLFDDETYNVTVTNVNEAPSFTSSATANAPENQTGALTVTATDPEGNAITFSITGGADQALFSINGTTGVVTFNAPPNFEAPADAGANNVYDIVVTASDGTNTPTQAIAITVTDANEPPVFTSSATPSAAENQTAAVTVTTSDVENDTITYSITGGADQLLFTINSSTGAVTFNSAPNFEAPGDAGANNVYDIVVTATDGTSSPTQAIAITVTDVNEAPSFTSANSANVPENNTAVLTVTTTDPEGNAITYSISGGADAADFVINGTTGALTFAVAPDFENPADSDGNNVYEVIVKADDGPNEPTQTITVTVTPVEEGPAFTSANSANYAENGVGTAHTATAVDPEGDAVTYSITGGTDTDDLTINPTTGAITFNASPNFEAPTDSDTNNTYVIDVTATSTGGTAVQTITITVTDVNETPTITSGAPANVPENSASPFHTVTATDPDGTSPTFSIVGGADAADFSINTTTGALSFVATPNFEAPTDADLNNTYLITVRATDGTLFDDESYTITVTNVNEAPTAGTDAYNYIGNTELRIDGHAGNAFALAFTTDPDNPIDNDSDPDSIASGFGTITIVAVPSGTSAQGGTYRLESDGTMWYTPPAGHTGADSITYQLTDGTNVVNGTINFTMTGTDVVWYVKNNDGTADGVATKDGTSSFPFNTLAAASTASDVNEIIYVHSGDGTTTGQNNGIVLKNNQKLWGQGIALVVNGSTTLIGAGTIPQIGNTGGAGVSITNLSGIQVRGLNIGGSTDAVSAVLNVASTVTLQVSENIIRSAGNEGIDVDASAGNYSVAIHDNTLTSTGNAIDIAESGAGQITITAFDDLAVTGTTGGRGINVTGATFDTVAGGTFTTVNAGAISIGSAGAGNGVGGSAIVLTNVAGDLSFGTLFAYADNGSGLEANGTTAYTGSAGLQVTATGGTHVIQATGGPAVSLNTVTANLVLSQIVSTNSTGNGVGLTSVVGTFSVGGTSQITNAASTDFFVSTSNVDVTYPGTITDDQGQLVTISSNTGTRTILFSGAVTDGDDGDGTGITMSGNSAGTTVRFSGGLVLSTGTAAALSASGGGVLEVCDEAACNEAAAGALINKLTTTTGTALNVSSTTIGVNGLEFRSISSDGGANVGINLSATGTSGTGLIVRGNGGSCTSAATCTGGAIQNKTVNGITLDNASDVSLSNMFINNNDGSGIGGTSATDLTIANSRITNNSDTATGVEAGIRFTSMSGTSSITNTVISGSSEDEIRITPSSGSFTLNITGGTIGPNSATTGGNLVSLIGTNTATWTLNVSGVTFTGARASAIMSNMSNTGKGTVSVSGSTFTNNGKGISIGNSQSADHDFDLDGNTLTGSISNAIEWVSSTDATTGSVTRGVINNNVIGNGTADSGSQNLYGIAIDNRGDGDTILRISGNNVQNSDVSTIFVSVADFGALAGKAGFDLIMTGNTGGKPDDNSVAPIGQVYGMLLDVQDGTSACASISGNTSTGVTVEDLRVRVRDTAVFAIERLTDGDATAGETLTTAQTETHLNSENPGSSPTDASVFAGATGFREATNGQCRTWPGL